MLNGLYYNQNSILDEKDALTGKSKKELFIEIYNGLVTKINDFFSNDRSWKYRNIVIYDGSTVNYDEWNNGIYNNYNERLKEIYTPYQNYKNIENIRVNEDLTIVRNILKNIKTPIVLDKWLTVKEDNSNELINDLIMDLYDVHPISVIAELSYDYRNSGSTSIRFDNIISSAPDSSYTRSGYLFPRNRVTNDMINQIKLYEPKIFSSLEAASSILDKAKEDTILGNNANYSFIGGLGGSVTDEEDTVDSLNHCCPVDLETKGGIL
jgi:hypothetical protein